MITLPRYDLHAVPHLVSVGVVGGHHRDFFCVGFLLLARPHPVRLYADPFPPAQTMEELVRERQVRSCLAVEEDGFEPWVPGEGDDGSPTTRPAAVRGMLQLICFAARWIE